MSVYTDMSQNEIERLLSLFSLGSYQSHKGISAGVENTNFFVETSSHSLVLTIFEKHTAEELPFYLQLSEHLHNQHCKVPRPYRSNAGELLTIVKYKPAVFIERLSGAHVSETAPYIKQIAESLAEIHVATAQFQQTQPHSHDKGWVLTQAQSIVNSLPLTDQSLLNASINAVQKIPKQLPSGIIHGDLFHDNALFDNGHISGIIDWYFAGIDSYALDIAITINDWCRDNSGQFNLRSADEFTAAYQSKRALSDIEINAIPLLQIQSATRFWLSRLLAKQQHLESNDKVTVKDPDEMKQLLKQLLSYC